jgi:SAM-dependent methyltransferase
MAVDEPSTGRATAPTSPRYTISGGVLRERLRAPPARIRAAMPRTYEHFARHYDALMDAGPGARSDPLGNATRVLGYLERHAPGARSLLELGCGSGAILAGLGRQLSLTGIDRSPQMLARARAKVPRARLLEGDIASFELAERLDAVVCVFDTLNHLEGLAAWNALFERAAAHLHSGGLFAFDVNTVGQLRRLAAAPPWLRELPAATVTQHVDWLGEGRAIWHVLIEERLPGEGIVCHHERIPELGVPLATIAAALDRDFELLECADEQGAAPSEESARAYFAWRRRRRFRR